MATVPSLQPPSAARLLFEVAALRLQVKMLEAEVVELKARPSERDPDAV
jgi:hypothetical protein